MFSIDVEESVTKYKILKILTTRDKSGNKELNWIVIQEESKGERSTVSSLEKLTISCICVATAVLKHVFNYTHWKTVTYVRMVSPDITSKEQNLNPN